jgi:hypothetical protein
LYYENIKTLKTEVAARIYDGKCSTKTDFLLYIHSVLVDLFSNVDDINIYIVTFNLCFQADYGQIRLYGGMYIFVLLC